MRTTNDFKIKVSKNKLLKSLNTNLKKHTEDYQEAVEKFCKLLRVNYSMKLDRIAEAMETSPPDLIKLGDLGELVLINHPVPVSYEETYEQVIQMLYYTDQDEIEITADQYRAWVEDQWDWHSAFVGSTLSYK